MKTGTGRESEARVKHMDRWNVWNGRKRQGNKESIQDTFFLKIFDYPRDSLNISVAILIQTGFNHFQFFLVSFGIKVIIKYLLAILW